MKNKHSFLSITVLLLLAALPAAVNASWVWLNPKPQGNNLRAAWFFDPANGLAVGDAGTILRTTNGGIEWTLQYLSGTRLNAITFADPMTGYACGEAGVIAKTTDSGLSWSLGAIPSAVMLNALQFPEGAQTGFACGDSDRRPD